MNASGEVAHKQVYVLHVQLDEQQARHEEQMRAMAEKLDGAERAFQEHVSLLRHQHCEELAQKFELSKQAKQTMQDLLHAMEQVAEVTGRCQRLGDELGSERQSRLEVVSELAATREQLENLRIQLSDITSLNEQLEIRLEMASASLLTTSADLVSTQLAHRTTTAKLGLVSMQLSLSVSNAQSQQAQSKLNEDLLLQKMASAENDCDAKIAQLQLQLEQANKKIAQATVAGVANLAAAGLMIETKERTIGSLKARTRTQTVSQAWQSLSDRLRQKRVVRYLSAELVRCHWLRLVQGIGQLHVCGKLLDVLIAMRRHALHLLAEKQAEILQLLAEPEDPGPPWQRTMGGGFAVRVRHRATLSSALTPPRANYRGRREEIVPAQIQFGLTMQPGDERDSPGCSSPLQPVHPRPYSASNCHPPESEPEARKRQNSPPRRSLSHATASSIPPSGKVCKLCKHSVFSLLQQ